MNPSRSDRRRFLAHLGLGVAGVPALANLALSGCSAAPGAAPARTAATALDLDELRAAYDLDPAVTYLNHASIGTVPRAVRLARQQFDAVCETNPWLYVWGDGWTDALENARSRAAAFLGGGRDEVAVTHNTTEAFSLLAQGLPLGPGDEVLFSSINHVGASACWHHQAPRRGFEVRTFEFPVADAPSLSAADVVSVHAEQITERTAVLVLPHLDNVVGVRHPLREIAAAARERGVRFVAVDAAQTIGMVPVNAGETGVDFLATSGHKWLQAPKGTGLLYARREAQAALSPMWVTWGQQRYRGTAQVYADYGTRDLGALLALGEAVAFQEALGAERKDAHYRELHAHLQARVDAEPRLHWRSPRRYESGGSLYAIEREGTPSAELAAQLYEQRGFVLRPFQSHGLNTLRVSPNAMNTRAELDALVGALRDAGP